jgi:hypothetical protein
MVAIAQVGGRHHRYLRAARTICVTSPIAPADTANFPACPSRGRSKDRPDPLPSARRMTSSSPRALGDGRRRAPYRNNGKKMLMRAMEPGYRRPAEAHRQADTHASRGSEIPGQRSL